jgi:predicted dehydrogenase
MVLKLEQCRELGQIATDKKLVLMEGHLLLYHGAVLRLKQALDDGLIGKVHHLYFRRTNLGAIRFEANVLWDVGPHDFSVMLYLLNGQMPCKIAAFGSSTYLPNNPEVVFTSFHFADGLTAHFHESWIDPGKDRKLSIVGTKGMLVLDEHATDGKVKMLRKQIVDTKATLEHQRFSYQDDGVEVLTYPEVEPLRSEMEHFFSCIQDGRLPRSNSANSLKVLELLLASQQALDQQTIVQL